MLLEYSADWSWQPNLARNSQCYASDYLNIDTIAENSKANFVEYKDYEYQIFLIKFTDWIYNTYDERNQLDVMYRSDHDVW